MFEKDAYNEFDKMFQLDFNCDAVVFHIMMQ